MSYTFGADPETFIIDRYTGDNFPAYLFFPNTGKGNCYSLGADIGGVHADNIMLEFNPAPADNFLSVAQTLYHSTLMAVDLMADSYAKKKVALKKKYRMDAFYPQATSAIQLDLANVEYYQDHVEFYEIGCEPDYNAYTRGKNPMPKLPDNVRVAGGHIMISALDERLKDPEIIINAVKWMDVLVMPTIIQGLKVSGNYDTTSSRTRRLYYGKAGCFRPKEFPNGAYGVEYRTPGPEWTRLIESRQGEKYLTLIEEALITSVENAFEFKVPQVSTKLIEAAITLENNEALRDLMEIAYYV
jgi:hypothetical protein